MHVGGASRKKLCVCVVVFWGLGSFDNLTYQMLFIEQCINNILWRMHMKYYVIEIFSQDFVSFIKLQTYTYNIMGLGKWANNILACKLKLCAVWCLWVANYSSSMITQNLNSWPSTILRIFAILQKDARPWFQSRSFLRKLHYRLSRFCFFFASTCTLASS